MAVIPEGTLQPWLSSVILIFSAAASSTTFFHPGPKKTIESLVKGKTFYTYQNGIQELRSEISRYMNEIFNINTKPENHSVVTGGMMGLRNYWHYGC